VVFVTGPFGYSAAGLKNSSGKEKIQQKFRKKGKISNIKTKI